MVNNKRWDRTYYRQPRRLVVMGDSKRCKSEARPADVQLKRAAKFLTVIALTTKHAVCRITFMLYPILLWRIIIFLNWSEIFKIISTNKIW